MAKRLLLRTLSDVLDWWAEGIDSKQLEVKTRKGELQLSDVRFRKAALESFLGHEAEILDGSAVQRLSAKWSWSGLFTLPVQVEINGLCLEVKLGRRLPPRPTAVGAEPPAPAKGKKSRLRLTSALSKAVRPSGVSRLTQKALQQLTDRLVLTVGSLRIGLQLGDHARCGLLLDALSVQGNPEPTHIQDTQADARGLAVFLDPVAQAGGAGAPWAWPQLRHFLLEPVALRAAAQRTSGRRFRDLRGLAVQLELQPVRLSWSDEQREAVANGLEQLGLLDAGRLEELFETAKEQAAAATRPREEEDEAVLAELSKDTDAAALLRQEEALPAAGAEFKVTLATPLHLMFAVGRIAGIPLVGIEVEGDVQLSSSEERLKAHGRLRSAEVAEWSMFQQPAKSRRWMLQAPKGESEAVQVKLEQVAAAEERASLSVSIARLDVWLLPAWGDLIEVLGNARALNAAYWGKVAGWSAVDVTVNQLVLLIPASVEKMEALALRLSADAVGCWVEGPQELSWSLEGGSCVLLREHKRRELFKGADITLEMQGRRCCAEVHPVSVGVSLAQMTALVELLQGLSWLARLRPGGASEHRRGPPTGEALSWLVATGGLRFVVIDTEGLAANLALVAGASVVETFVTPRGSRCLKVSDFRLAAAGSQGRQDLVEKCTMEVTMGKTPEVRVGFMRLYSTVHRLHAVKLLVLAAESTLRPLWASEDATQSTGQSPGGQLYADAVEALIEDPEGICGGARLSVSIASLRCCAVKRSLGFSCCDVALGRSTQPPPRRSVSGSSASPSAASAASHEDLVLFRLLGSQGHKWDFAMEEAVSANLTLHVFDQAHLPGPCVEPGAHRTSSVGASAANTALRTESPASCRLSLGERALPPKKHSKSRPRTVWDILNGEVSIGTVALNSDDHFVADVATICGDVAGGARAVVDAKSAVFRNRNHGLKLNGAVVEAAHGAAQRKGFSSGCTLLSIGNMLVTADDDVEALLATAPLPTPVQFVRPAAEPEEMAVDLVIRPVTVQVDGYQTKTGRELHGTKFTLGEVRVEAWRGQPSQLAEMLGRRYTQELTRAFPVLSESFKVAKKVFKDSTTKAVDALRSKLTLTGVSLGEVETLALLGRLGDMVQAVEMPETRDLANGTMIGARKVGDAAVGIMAWSAEYLGLDFDEVSGGPPPSVPRPPQKAAEAATGRQPPPSSASKPSPSKSAAKLPAGTSGVAGGGGACPGSLAWCTAGYAAMAAANFATDLALGASAVAGTATEAASMAVTAAAGLAVDSAAAPIRTDSAGSGAAAPRRPPGRRGSKSTPASTRAPPSGGASAAGPTEVTSVPHKPAASKKKLVRRKKSSAKSAASAGPQEEEEEVVPPPSRRPSTSSRARPSSSAASDTILKAPPRRQQQQQLLVPPSDSQGSRTSPRTTKKGSWAAPEAFFNEADFNAVPAVEEYSDEERRPRTQGRRKRFVGQKPAAPPKRKPKPSHVSSSSSSSSTSSSSSDSDTSS